MSETEHNKGVLTPIKTDVTLENTARIIIEGAGEKLEDYYDSWLEKLEDWGQERYYIAETQIYSVSNREIDPDEEISIASKNEDGSINFETKFYNGGCGFNEAIDKAIKKWINPLTP